MSPTLSRRSVLRAAAAAAATTVAAPLIMSAAEQAVSAATPGDPGKITYRVGETLYIADSNGANARVLAYGVGTRGEWAPDGTRYFYGAASVLNSVKADGTGWLRLLTTTQTPASPVTDLTVTPDGRLVVFSGPNGVRYAGTGADWWDSSPLFSGTQIGHLSVAPNYDIYYDQGDVWVPDTKKIYRYNDATGTSTPLIANGWDPEVSPDGSQIVYVKSDWLNGRAQLWLANLDGSNPTQLTVEETAGLLNHKPKWSPDGTAILFNSGDSAIKKIVLATKKVTLVVANGMSPAWQPVNSGLVERVWGQTALDTAVATSRWNYATHGQPDTVRSPAKSVTLSRNDTYFDALAGSALAVNKQGPLLVTPREGLPANVEAEIVRVLGTSGDVYLLGGTAALPPVIESRLRSLGFTTHRVFGNTVFDTAIAVANAIAPAPDTIIVATALNYFDALAAGAAAGASPGTVIVLTAGNDMPSETAAYLNRFDPTQVDIVTAGGPGDRALINAYVRGQLPNWEIHDRNWGRYDLVGQAAQDTARMIAEFFFGAPRRVGIATVASWYDALTGGAMIGANYGPLLITSPTSLDHQVSDYLSAHSASVWDVVLIGGTGALPAALVAPIGNSFSLPGHYTTSETTPENSLNAKAPQAKSLAAAQPNHDKAASGGVPGLKTEKSKAPSIK
ncbi:cell wall-binding repeat-containing protein [Dactylosporangium salmoneum]|uniref:WD40 repeat protein n=1 Tax=Dactylosporangium salmoneum TaxID=53361 RepID=A0ABP5SDZ4_9ACTN